MRSSPVAIAISIVILFIGLIVLPSYYIGIVNWRNDMDTAMTAGRDFIDKAIDTRQISQDMEDDLNLALAGCSAHFSYSVVREIPITNPTAGNNGKETYTSYIQSENLKEEFQTGDIITIEIKQESDTLFQRIAQTFLSTAYAKKTIRFSAMVR